MGNGTRKASLWGEHWGDHFVDHPQDPGFLRFLNSPCNSQPSGTGFAEALRTYFAQSFLPKGGDMVSTRSVKVIEMPSGVVLCLIFFRMGSPGTKAQASSETF